MESNDEEVRLSDLTVINEIEMQSNTVVSTESSVTESKIMDDVVIHSMPVQIKKADDHDMMKMMQLILEKNTMLQLMLDVQFDEQKSDINKRFDINDIKLNEQNSKLNELSNDNVKFEMNMNKRLNEIEERDVYKRQAQISSVIVSLSCFKYFD